MRLAGRLAVTLSLALAPVAAWSQDEKQNPQERQALQRVEWRLNALKRELSLSTTQEEQIKKVLLDTEKSTTQLQDEQRKKVEGLLTPEQKERYQALQQRQQGRPGGGGGPGGGMMQRFGFPSLDQIREQLGLTPEQEKKAQEIIQGTMQEFGEKMREMREGGRGFDFEAMRKNFEEVQKATREKIAGILNDEQKKKFAELNKGIDERMQRMMGQFRLPGGEGGGGFQLREDPQAQIRRRTQQAMADLKLPAEETAVIQPLIEKIVTFQVESQRKLDGVRGEISKLAGEGNEAAVKEKVAEFRKARDEAAKKRALLQDGLRELLTAAQEAKLIARGILE